MVVNYAQLNQQVAMGTDASPDSNADFVATRVASLLGGRRVLGCDVRTATDLERVVEAGLPYRSLTLVLRWFDRSPEAGEVITRIVAPRTTLLRRERSGTLSREESERLERVARLTALAEYVWESAEDGQEFLTAPHRMLDSRPPLTLAATELGARRVERLLWSLEYSLPV